MDNTQATAPVAEKAPAPSEALIDAALKQDIALADIKETEAAPKEDDRFAPKFAALSKKEREIKRQQQELKQRLQDLEARETKYKSYEERKAQAKLDPLSYLKEADLSYDELTQFFLNDQKPSADTKVSMLEAKLEQMEKRLQDKLKEEETSKTQAVINEFQSKIAATLQSNVDKYELTNTFGNPETVYNLIDQHYQETGSILDIEEACDLAEAYFEKNAEEQASKMLRVKKLSSKFSSLQHSEPTKAEAKPSASEKKPTLTNELSQNLPTRQDRPMTDRERLKKAAELIKFL